MHSLVPSPPRVSAKFSEVLCLFTCFYQCWKQSTLLALPTLPEPHLQWKGGRTHRVSQWWCFDTSVWSMFPAEPLFWVRHAFCCSSSAPPAEPSSLPTPALHGFNPLGAAGQEELCHKGVPWCGCHQLLEGINGPRGSAQNFGIRTNISHLK